jgi:hypothetical protein
MFRILSHSSTASSFLHNQVKPAVDWKEFTWIAQQNYLYKGGGSSWSVKVWYLKRSRNILAVLTIMLFSDVNSTVEVLSCLKYITSYMETEISLPCSRQPATRNSPQSHECSLYLHDIIFKIQFNKILPFTPRCPKYSLPFMFSDYKVICISHLSHTCYVHKLTHPPWLPQNSSKSDTVCVWYFLTCFSFCGENF